MRCHIARRMRRRRGHLPRRCGALGISAWARPAHPARQPGRETRGVVKRSFACSEGLRTTMPSIERNRPRLAYRRLTLRTPPQRSGRTPRPRHPRPPCPGRLRGRCDGKAERQEDTEDRETPETAREPRCHLRSVQPRTRLAFECQRHRLQLAGGAHPGRIDNEHQQLDRWLARWSRSG
jgi:hypothetical protein